VKTVLAALICLCPASALAWPEAFAPAAQTPHPAVARIIVAERDGTSMGSGALVAVDASHGLVVTNWHVVRDAAGPITVVFPDGFRSGALVLGTDRDWDLAALAIQRPAAQPLPLATETPRPGEPLTIAGYGPDGVYRAVGGRCTEYLSPGGNLPAELVEVDVQARRGDSGGPIYNSRGEVAGILFGAGGNFLTGVYTMGSYCGRVRQFLAVPYVAFQRLPGNTTMLAQAPAPLPPPPVTVTPNTTLPARSSPLAENAVAGSATVARQTLPQVPALTGEAASGLQQHGAGIRPSSTSVPSSPVAQVSPATENTQSEPPPSRTDQIKTVLAVIGIIAILFHGLRLVGSAVG